MATEARLELNSEADYPERTLCQVNREMYRLLKAKGITDQDPAIRLLYEAYDMGKKLNNKLRQYKYNYDDGWWSENKLSGGNLWDDDEITPV